MAKKQNRSHKGDPRISKVKLREYLNDIIQEGYSTIALMEKSNIPTVSDQEKGLTINLIYGKISACEAIRNKFCQ